MAADRLPLLLDTDLGTNVDDALALAYAVRHPGVDLQGVLTVSGDSVRRAQLAQALLRAAGRADVPVRAGRPGFEERAWSGHEGRGMPPGWEQETVPSGGWEELLAGFGGTLVTLGMLTNLATLLQHGTRPPLHRLVVMGGLFPPTDLPLGRDHNLVTDPESAAVALGAGYPTLLVPVDVTVRTGLLPRHVDRLRGGDPLAQLLAGLLDAFVPRTGHAVSGGRVAHLHDPLAVACAVDAAFVRSCVRIERLPITVARRGAGVRTFVDPLAGTPTDVVRDVDVDAVAAHWLQVVLEGRP